MPPGPIQAEEHWVCALALERCSVPHNQVAQQVSLLQLGVSTVFWEITCVPEHPVKVYTEN